MTTAETEEKAADVTAKKDIPKSGMYAGTAVYAGGKAAAEIRNSAADRLRRNGNRANKKG